MKKLILILAATLVLVLGASGNFREYYGARGVAVSIADNNSSYIAFECPEITLYLQSGESSGVISVKNNLGEDAELYFSTPDDILTFTNPTFLYAGEEKLVEAEFTGGHGEYTIPIDIEAFWANGSARIPACSVEVVNPLVKISKILLEGDTEVPLFEREVWKFRILVESEIGDNYTILDTIPAEFEVLSITSSSGSHTEHHPGVGRSGVTKIVWEVHVEGSEFMDVTVATKLNPAGKQEFTSPGSYNLNDGAEIKGLGIVSNPIIVNAVRGVNNGE
ncbi:hypothetical protein [Archaeoglobus sp.]